MSKKLKNPTAWDVLFGQKQPPTAAERLMSNARFLVDSMMSEPVRITHISQDNGISEANMTIFEYRQLYGHRVASIIEKTETESDCRHLTLPSRIHTENSKGETELVPFEHNILVYTVFDPKKHDFYDVNIVASRLLAGYGSPDQAVWDAAMVSSALRIVIDNQ